MDVNENNILEKIHKAIQIFREIAASKYPDQRASTLDWRKAVIELANVLILSGHTCDRILRLTDLNVAVKCFKHCIDRQSLIFAPSRSSFHQSGDSFENERSICAAFTRWFHWALITVLAYSCESAYAHHSGGSCEGECAVSATAAAANHQEATLQLVSDAVYDLLRLTGRRLPSLHRRLLNDYPSVINRCLSSLSSGHLEPAARNLPAEDLPFVATSAGGLRLADLPLLSGGHIHNTASSSSFSLPNPGTKASPRTSSSRHRQQQQHLLSVTVGMLCRLAVGSPIPCKSPKIAAAAAPTQVIGRGFYLLDAGFQRAAVSALLTALDYSRRTLGATNRVTTSISASDNRLEDIDSNSNIDVGADSNTAVYKQFSNLSSSTCSTCPWCSHARFNQLCWRLLVNLLIRSDRPLDRTLGTCLCDRLTNSLLTANPNDRCRADVCPDKSLLNDQSQAAPPFSQLLTNHHPLSGGVQGSWTDHLSPPSPEALFEFAGRLMTARLDNRVLSAVMSSLIFVSWRIVSPSDRLGCLLGIDRLLSEAPQLHPSDNFLPSLADLIIFPANHETLADIDGSTAPSTNSSNCVGSLVLRLISEVFTSHEELLALCRLSLRLLRTPVQLWLVPGSSVSRYVRSLVLSPVPGEVEAAPHSEAWTSLEYVLFRETLAVAAELASVAVVGRSAALVEAAPIRLTSESTDDASAGAVVLERMSARLRQMRGLLLAATLYLAERPRLGGEHDVEDSNSRPSLLREGLVQPEVQLTLQRVIRRFMDVVNLNISWVGRLSFALERVLGTLRQCLHLYLCAVLPLDKLGTITDFPLRSTFCESATCLLGFKYLERVFNSHSLDPIASSFGEASRSNMADLIRLAQGFNQPMCQDTAPLPFISKMTCDCCTSCRTAPSADWSPFDALALLAAAGGHCTDWVVAVFREACLSSADTSSSSSSGLHTTAAASDSADVSAAVDALPLLLHAVGGPSHRRTAAALLPLLTGRLLPTLARAAIAAQGQSESGRPRGPDNKTPRLTGPLLRCYRRLACLVTRSCRLRLCPATGSPCLDCTVCSDDNKIRRHRRQSSASSPSSSSLDPELLLPAAKLLVDADDLLKLAQTMVFTSAVHHITVRPGRESPIMQQLVTRWKAATLEPRKKGNLYSVFTTLAVGLAHSLHLFGETVTPAVGGALLHIQSLLLQPKTSCHVSRSVWFDMLTKHLYTLLKVTCQRPECSLGLLFQLLLGIRGEAVPVVRACVLFCLADASPPVDADRLAPDWGRFAGQAMTKLLVAASDTNTVEACLQSCYERAVCLEEKRIELSKFIRENSPHLLAALSTFDYAVAAKIVTVLAKAGQCSTKRLLIDAITELIHCAATAPSAELCELSWNFHERLFQSVSLPVGQVYRGHLLASLHRLLPEVLTADSDDEADKNARQERVVHCVYRLLTGANGCTHPERTETGLSVVDLDRLGDLLRPRLLGLLTLTTARLGGSGGRSGSTSIARLTACRELAACARLLGRRHVTGARRKLLATLQLTTATVTRDCGPGCAPLLTACCAAWHALIHNLDVSTLTRGHLVQAVLTLQSLERLVATTSTKAADDERSLMMLAESMHTLLVQNGSHSLPHLAELGLSAASPIRTAALSAPYLQHSHGGKWLQLNQELSSALATAPDILRDCRPTAPGSPPPPASRRHRLLALLSSATDLLLAPDSSSDVTGHVIRRLADVLERHEPLIRRLVQRSDTCCDPRISRLLAALLCRQSHREQQRLPAPPPAERRLGRRTQICITTNSSGNSSSSNSEAFTELSARGRCLGLLGAIDPTTAATAARLSTVLPDRLAVVVPPSAESVGDGTRAWLGLTAGTTLPRSTRSKSFDQSSVTPASPARTASIINVAGVGAAADDPRLAAALLTEVAGRFTGAGAVDVRCQDRCAFVLQRLLAHYRLGAVLDQSLPDAPPDPDQDHPVWRRLDDEVKEILRPLRYSRYRLQTEISWPDPTTDRPLLHCVLPVIATATTTNITAASRSATPPSPPSHDWLCAFLVRLARRHCPASSSAARLVEYCEALLAPAPASTTTATAGAAPLHRPLALRLLPPLALTALVTPTESGSTTTATDFIVTETLVVLRETAAGEAATANSTTSDDAAGPLAPQQQEQRQQQSALHQVALAQCPAVFALLDHLELFVLSRQIELSSAPGLRPPRSASSLSARLSAVLAADLPLCAVHRLLARLPDPLLGQAATRCGLQARAIYYAERRLRASSALATGERLECLDLIQQAARALDEPDLVEGVASVREASADSLESAEEEVDSGTASSELDSRRRRLGEQLLLYRCAGRLGAAAACQEALVPTSDLLERGVACTQLAHLYLEMGHTEAASLIGEGLAGTQGATGGLQDDGRLHALRVEAAWRLCRWDRLEGLLSPEQEGQQLEMEDAHSDRDPSNDLTPRPAPTDCWHSNLAGLLLAVHRGRQPLHRIVERLSRQRAALVEQLLLLHSDAASSAALPYERGYPLLLRLHALEDLRSFLHWLQSSSSSNGSSPRLEHSQQSPSTSSATRIAHGPTPDWDQLWTGLERRLQRVRPTVACLEPLLALHRTLARLAVHRLTRPSCFEAALGTAAAAGSSSSDSLIEAAARRRLAQLWLMTAKTARRGGLLQTAHGALLKADICSNCSANSQAHSAVLTTPPPRLLDPVIGDSEEPAVEPAAGEDPVAGQIVEGLQLGVERAKWLAADGRLDLAQAHLETLLGRLHGGGGRRHGSVVTSEDQRLVYAKALLLYARYSEQTCCLESSVVIRQYRKVIEVRDDWEAGHFYLTKYYHRLYTNTAAAATSSNAGAGQEHQGRLVTEIVKHAGRSLTHGCEHLYESLPLMLSHWLDYGALVASVEKRQAKEAPESLSATAAAAAASVPSGSRDRYAELLRSMKGHLAQIDKHIDTYRKQIPDYCLLVCLPQLLSRICHRNPVVWKTLRCLLADLVAAYPQQALWSAVSLLTSTDTERARRCSEVIDLAHSVRQNAPASSASPPPMQSVSYIAEGGDGLSHSPADAVDDLSVFSKHVRALAEQLILLCDLEVPKTTSQISLRQHCARLVRLLASPSFSRISVPLQATMLVRLPSASDSRSTCSAAAFSHSSFPGRQQTAAAADSDSSQSQMSQSQAPPPFSPFTSDAATESGSGVTGSAPVYIAGIEERCQVLGSLVRPKKIALRGSDGRSHPFLAKPKDDLRKDCRLLEFTYVVNRFLAADPEARRRSLLIRTYYVVPLNGECGLIEWVPNMHGFRNLVMSLYERHPQHGSRAEGSPTQGSVRPPTALLGPMSNSELKLHKVDAKAPIERKLEVFRERLLPRHPAVFDQWFVETFATLPPSSPLDTNCSGTSSNQRSTTNTGGPGPRWLAARLAYTRSAAVMSVVGYILGLGDRHGENLMLDATTGHVFHVDFNCLFNKGESFEYPEVVPFRLTHNMVAAMGICGYEGPFRKAAEITLRVLNERRDPLMNILRTLIYDPLVEWSRVSGQAQQLRGSAAALVGAGVASNAAHQHTSDVAAGLQASDEAAAKARQCMQRVEKRLQLIPYKPFCRLREMPLSVEGHVNFLIAEATDHGNLAKMYIGWAPFL